MCTLVFRMRIHVSACPRQDFGFSRLGMSAMAVNSLEAAVGITAVTAAAVAVAAAAAAVAVAAAAVAVAAAAAAVTISAAAAVTISAAAAISSSATAITIAAAAAVTISAAAAAAISSSATAVSSSATAVAATAVAATAVAATAVAAAAAAVLLAATGDRFGAVLALTLVKAVDELDARALLEHVAVLDGREMTEDVLATIVGLDEAKTLGGNAAFGSQLPGGVWRTGGWADGESIANRRGLSVS